MQKHCKACAVPRIATRGEPQAQGGVTHHSLGELLAVPRGLKVASRQPCIVHAHNLGQSWVRMPVGKVLREFHFGSSNKRYRPAAESGNPDLFYPAARIQEVLYPKK